MKITINPKILTWDREERNKLTIKMLADRMKRNPSEIQKWENGTEKPTYGQLENLAYKYLKVPVAVFFFPIVPDVQDPIKKFRRLPDYEMSRLSDDTFRKIRLAQAYQDSLLIIAENHISKKIFKDIIPGTLSASSFARKVRKYLPIDLREQFSFKSLDSAFKRWRHLLEECGIFTFKDTFKDKFISGFCLIHDIYPIIFINNSNSFSRQIFTLFHELGHILFGLNGITDIDESYLSFLNKKEQNIEIFCNEFASQVLVPEEGFEEVIIFYKKSGMFAVEETSRKYSVSREVILRRLLNRGVISDSFYNENVVKWNRDFLRKTKDKSGGNYYLTRLSYIGEGYAKTAFAQYRKGRIEQSTLANHLNIKTKNLNKLISLLR